MEVVVDLDNSNYDTALGVYDSTDTALVLANDDWNGLQSYVQCHLFPGTYYIVVDGYSSSEGDYEIAVYEIMPDPDALIEIEEVEAYPGDDVQVGIFLEWQDVALNSAEFQFDGFQDYDVDFTGISLEGTQLGDLDWAVEFNNTDSMLYVALAGADGINMELSLIHI